MSKVFLNLAVLAVATPATALQPLDTFLQGARTSGTEVAEARALRSQARAESDAALGRALPRLSLRGSYTRNEFETTLRLPAQDGGETEVTISAREQLDGAAALEVPLLDLSSFARVGAARTGARAAARQEASADLQTQARVSQDYHQLVANRALVAASRRALEVARASLRTATHRHEAGAVPLLDVDRARAEVERNVQQLASAELQVSLVARSLESRSGITPALDGDVTLADDLHDEPPLDRFQPPDAQLPALDAAILTRVASEQQARAQRLALLPSLSASFTERVTSAEGLGGQDAYWQGIVALTWTLDLTTVAGIRAQQAAAAGARAREQRVRLAARDAIHAAWTAVRSHIARSRSARVQAEVSARAADLAHARYQAGEATQLDLLQAQRDAFAADAARIQADADLVNARAQLRIAAGQSLLARPTTQISEREPS